MNAQTNERRERALRCANASLWLLGSILPRPDGRLGRLECRIIGSDYPLLRTQEMDLKSDTVASDVLRRWTWLSTWAPDAYEGMETDAV